MKKLLLLTVLLSVLVSCGGRKQIEKQLYSGNYDVAITNALKKLENKRACAVNAVGVLEPFDMFTLVFTGYRLQVETRFKQLSDILVKSYAKQLDQLMESICNEYSSIADRMLQVPEDSEDLKELIQEFDILKSNFHKSESFIKKVAWTIYCGDTKLLLQKKIKSVLKWW